MHFLLSLITGIFLFAAIMVANALQVLSLLIFPFSRHLFRRANRWVAHCWWGLCVLWAEHINHIHPVFSGDEIPEKENALVIVNHQTMPDIVAMMMLAWPKKRLGDMKWFVKDVIKFFPGVGWGMLFLDCIFLKRNWDQDATNIKNTFSKFRTKNIPLWLLSFPEGTRLTPKKLKMAQDFARKASHPEPRHVLIPRTRGFVASVSGLRTHLDAVYDVTVIYPEGAPTMGVFLGQTNKKIHIHVRRYAIDDVPQDTEQLSKWLIERYQEKDLYIDKFNPQPA